MVYMPCLVITCAVCNKKAILLSLCCVVLPQQLGPRIGIENNNIFCLRFLSETMLIKAVQNQVFESFLKWGWKQIFADLHDLLRGDTTSILIMLGSCNTGWFCFSTWVIIYAITRLLQCFLLVYYIYIMFKLSNT